MSRYLAHAMTRRVTGGPGVGLRGLPLRWIQSGELGKVVRITYLSDSPVETTEPIWIASGSGMISFGYPMGKSA